ncbi:MAG: hypothetical protein R2763_09640 [Mycobacterium sp.]
MQISLRSPSVVGAVAVMGVGAIVSAQVNATHLGHKALDVPLVASPTVLTAASFDNPISVLTNTAVAAWDFLFDPNDKTFGPLVQSDGMTAYESFWGVLPETIFQANPVATQIVFNVSNYVDGIGDAVFMSIGTLADGVWALPGAVVSATEKLFSGDILGALETLATAVVDPIVEAAGGLVAVLGAAVGNVFENLKNVAQEVPTALLNYWSAISGGASAVFEAAVTTVRNTVSALTSGDLAGAWNAAVNGLLGSGATDIPGAIINATIGFSLPGMTPSLRFATESAINSFANAIDGGFLGSKRYYPVLQKASSSAAVLPASSAATAQGEAAFDSSPQELPAPVRAASSTETEVSGLDSVPVSGGAAETVGPAQTTTPDSSRTSRAQTRASSAGRDVRQAGAGGNGARGAKSADPRR